MRKKLLTLGIVALMFFSTFNYAYAVNPSKTTNSIVTPQTVLCPYWPDGNHHYEQGSSSYSHHKLYQHDHIIYDDLGGIIEIKTDWYCDIYYVQDYFCACGKHSPISTYSSHHCHSL